jgi:putative transposase
MESGQRQKRKFKTYQRCNVPGDAHSLTFTCFHRRPFLSKERTCRWLADAIDIART